MSSVIDFLLENSIEDITDVVTLSLRRNGVSQIHDFKVKALSSPRYKEIKARSLIRNERKPNVNYDYDKLQLLICAECIIEPNFKNSDIQDKLGVKTADSAIEKILLPGEISDIYKCISLISGFDADINEDIEEAKN